MLSKQEIRQLGNRELMDELERSRRELLKRKFEVRSGSSKEAHMIKNLKRYIALLHTLTKEMKMEEKPESAKKETAAAMPAEEKKAQPKTAAKKASTKKTASAKTPAKKSKASTAKSSQK